LGITVSNQTIGDGKLDLLMNERYPAIRPTTVREYVARVRP
jgi:hypothetical protein